MLDLGKLLGGLMPTQIAGYILRANQRHVTARFYEELGLVTNEHQHGGPKHYEIKPQADNCVTEVYQRSESFPHDTLMLNVDSISNSLAVAIRYGLTSQTELRETADMKFIYIKDPDGRSLMLIEPK